MEFRRKEWWSIGAFQKMGVCTCTCIHTYISRKKTLRSKQIRSPLQYSKESNGKRFPEKDSTSDENDLRIKEYRLGRPFLINLPVITGALSRTSPLALIWKSGKLAKRYKVYSSKTMTLYALKFRLLPGRVYVRLSPLVETNLHLSGKTNFQQKLA